MKTVADLEAELRAQRLQCAMELIQVVASKNEQIRRLEALIIKQHRQIAALNRIINREAVPHRLTEGQYA